eukprot:COSAG01_NODE_16940_length_1192_cov_1.003660_2_plen_87_part_00
MRVPKGSGFDYLGEPTPFSFPNRNSNWGIHDLAGLKKVRFVLFCFCTQEFCRQYSTCAAVVLDSVPVDRICTTITEQPGPVQAKIQ